MSKTDTESNSLEERQARLNLAIAHIEKEFGKGTVMKMDADPQPVPAISTGAMSLDLALGIGGFPKGRIIEVFGEESTGKCLVGETHVWTDRGLETIDELFNRTGIQLEGDKDVVNVMDNQVYVSDMHNKPQQVEYVACSGRRAIYQITTEMGHQVRATGNHQFVASIDHTDKDFFSVEDILSAFEDGLDVHMQAALFGAAVTADHNRDPQRGLLTEEQARQSAASWEHFEEVPLSIRTAPFPVMRAFLKEVLTDTQLECKTSKARRQLQLMLAGFGVQTQIMPGSHNKINICGWLDPDRLLMNYDKVVSIKYIGHQMTYDLQVSGSQTFLAEGLMTHNSTLCLSTVAQAQKEGGLAAFIDVEHSVDPQYAKRLGVKVDEMYFSQPDSGEQALEVVNKLVATNALSILIVDSVAALVPQKELEGEVGDQSMALQARLMSQALRMLKGIINDSNTLVIFTNQIREKVGVVYGDPRTTPGGRALRFYSSVRAELRRVNKDAIKDKDTGVHTGMRVKASIVKNKVAPPFRETYFNINYGTGIDHEMSVIDTALDLGVLQQAGSWVKYGEESIAQGGEKAAQELRENQELYDTVVSDIYAQHDLLKT